jgi:hypothetical protein
VRAVPAAMNSRQPCTAFPAVIAYKLSFHSEVVGINQKTWSTAISIRTEECGSDSEFPTTSNNSGYGRHVPLLTYAVSEYPFKDYDDGEEKYTGDLALRHKEYMEYYKLGLLTTQNFKPETVDDVYVSNLYAISWFYGGVYPFDSYEAAKDSYFYD